MYIKPALPCLPFFVVYSINLLSRPEQGWERNATAKGVAESNCYIVQTERKLKLGDFRMWEQNFSGRGGLAVGRSQTVESTLNS
uniref:Uncharacterized protein n=1 Tax=Castor canadensis TaxID=51338 RepID=A0A8C0XXB8_CASCN